jgi:hypothetical protein
VTGLRKYRSHRDVARSAGGASLDSEDNWRPGSRVGVPEHPAKSQSVHTRHVPVGHDDVVWSAVCQLERLPPVERGGNVVLVGLKHEPHCFDGLGLVIHQ